jgi:hypothetical protein
MPEREYAASPEAFDDTVCYWCGTPLATNIMQLPPIHSPQWRGFCNVECESAYHLYQSDAS